MIYFIIAFGVTILLAVFFALLKRKRRPKEFYSYEVVPFKDSLDKEEEREILKEAISRYKKKHQSS